MTGANPLQIGINFDSKLLICRPHPNKPSLSLLFFVFSFPIPTNRHHRAPEPNTNPQSPEHLPSPGRIKGLSNKIKINYWDPCCTEAPRLTTQRPRCILGRFPCQSPTHPLLHQPPIVTVFSVPRKHRSFSFYLIIIPPLPLIPRIHLMISFEQNLPGHPPESTK